MMMTTPRRLQGFTFATMAALALALAAGTAGCPKKPKPFPTPIATETPAPAPTDSRDDGSGVGGTGTTGVMELDPEACLKPIKFDLDSSTLSAEGTTALKAAVECLRANPGWVIVAEGHADERGSTQYNVALGERRARSVSDYVVNAGIEKGRVSTVSFGEEKPKVPEHDESAWAENRRVEFRVKK